MRWRALVSLVAVLMLFSIAHAAKTMVIGAGTVSCGEWLKYRADRDVPTLYQLYAWIDGYLSGANSASNVNFLASQLNRNAMNAYVDDYCKSHALDNVATAADALANELVTRAHLADFRRTAQREGSRSTAGL